MKSIRRHSHFLLISLGVSLGFSLCATPIYRNSTNDLLARFSPGTLEIGDEIILGSTERYLTNFSFEFYGTNTANPVAFAGSISARVRFYVNDGPLFNGYATPGTMFYDSLLFPVSAPTPRNSFIFTAGSDFPANGLYIPTSDMTWSVQFSGMGATDDVGVDLYSPPTVGGNFSDYWEFNGSWALKTNAFFTTMSFGATFDAQVPEPSTFAMSLLGGLGAFAASGLFRRKK